MILSGICLLRREDSLEIQKVMDEISMDTGSKNALAFPPHFSLRNDFEIQSDNLDKLISDMQEIVGVFGKFKIRLNKYGFYKWRIIYLEIEITDTLRKLHSEIMNNVQKHRTGWVPKALLENIDFVGRQKSYIKEYGYQFAYEYYSPHITIAGNDMEEEVFQKEKAKLGDRKVNIEVIVEKVALIDREDDNRIIKTFDL